jgi:hypothetical protein
LRNQLDSGLQRELSLGSSHPHLFSELPVFVSEQDQRAMQAIIQAVESVVAMPAYQARALAPHAGLFGANSNGGILGYDFHITGDGPKLIEINTNPGGALLAVEMLKAQLLCCDLVRGYLNTTFIPDQVERQIVDAFRRDWARVRGSAALKAIAIVDESPAEQYLFPEFLLF